MSKIRQYLYLIPGIIVCKVLGMGWIFEMIMDLPLLLKSIPFPKLRSIVEKDQKNF